MAIAEAAFGVYHQLCTKAIEITRSLMCIYSYYDDCHQERISQYFDSEDMLKGNELPLVAANHRESNNNISLL